MVVLDDGIGVGLFDHMIDLRSIVRMRLLSLHRVLDDFARLHLNCVHDLLDMRLHNSTACSTVRCWILS